MNIFQELNGVSNPYKQIFGGISKVYFWKLCFRRRFMRETWICSFRTNSLISQERLQFAGLYYYYLWCLTLADSGQSNGWNAAIIEVRLKPTLAFCEIPSAVRSRVSSKSIRACSQFSFAPVVQKVGLWRRGVKASEHVHESPSQFAPVVQKAGLSISLGCYCSKSKQEWMQNGGWGHFPTFFWETPF